jgi:hypothetical protein
MGANRAKKDPQPPWAQAQQLVEQLGELLEQMDMEPTVAENQLTAIARQCLARLRKLSEQGLAGNAVQLSRKASLSPWTAVLELGTQLKAELDMMAEDSDVDTELWHNACVLTNRLLRLARKESNGT